MIRIAGKIRRKAVENAWWNSVVSLAVPAIQMNFGNNPFRTP